jgi:hypothetical protein
LSFNIKLEAVNFFQNKGCPHVAINALIEPHIALEIGNSHNYANQRPLSKSHSNMLAEAMRRGEFREFTSIDFAVLNGQPHLINGQHTLNAIVVARKKIWLSAHFHAVNSTQEIEKLYSKYDIGRKRSLRDSMGGIGEELKFSSKERDCLGTAVGWIQSGFRVVHSRDAADRVYESRDFELKKDLMREWSTEAAMFFSCAGEASGLNRQIFYRGAVAAVALYLFRFQTDRANEFFGGAARDDGLRTGDPRKSLINWLINNTSGASPNAQHRAVISCWNAYFTGRTYNKVFTNTDSALTLLGTPLEIKFGK